MLGELVGEERGQVTAIRVLPPDKDGPRVEVSFQASGKLLGLDVTDRGTYWSVLRPDGSLFGQGQGVAITAEGGEASWLGHGVGQMLGPGSAVSWRGALYYRSSSPALTRLNSVAVIFEYEVDEHGKTHARTWEWK